MTSTPLPEADEWGAPLVDSRPSPALERLFRRRTGLVPAVAPYVAPHPWAYRPFLFLMNPELRAIDEQLGAKICFVVARDNACRFCYGSFRSFLRVAGYTATELDRLEHELGRTHPNGAERRALQFAVEISQGRLDADESLSALRATGYGSKAIREIVGVAVMAALINRVATMLAVPVNEELETLTSRWLFVVLRPVVRAMLNGWKSVASPGMPPLQADAVDGALGTWIRPLRGTCVGHLLHDLTTQWIREGTALPLRTKLFMLSVVARGLGDAQLEERTIALLSDRLNGDITRRDAKETIDHLQGDTVGDRTAALLQLARESIWYEAGHLQTTVRSHTREIGRAHV